MSPSILKCIFSISLANNSISLCACEIDNSGDDIMPEDIYCRQCCLSESFCYGWYFLISWTILDTKGAINNTVITLEIEGNNDSPRGQFVGRSSPPAVIIQQLSGET